MDEIKTIDEIIAEENFCWFQWWNITNLFRVNYAVFKFALTKKKEKKRQDIDS